MGTKEIALLAAAALASPLVANAAPVTYDFTGTVFSSSTPGVTDGMTVTGTYVFDFDNPTSTSGTVGAAPSNWSVFEYGGAAYGTPAPTGVVFSSTAQVVGTGVSYASAPPGAYKTLSYVQSNSPDGWGALEEEEPTSSSATVSNIVINNLSAITYGSNGLPQFISASSSNYGLFESGLLSPNGIYSSSQQVAFEFTSLTPVPLPAAAWLMLSGLGGLGAMARKKRAA